MQITVNYTHSQALRKNQWDFYILKGAIKSQESGNILEIT